MINHETKVEGSNPADSPLKVRLRRTLGYALRHATRALARWRGAEPCGENSRQWPREGVSFSEHIDIVRRRAGLGDDYPRGCCPGIHSGVRVVACSFAASRALGPTDARPLAEAFAPTRL